MNIVTFEKLRSSYKPLLDILHSGGFIVFPSDTVYGLLCDATNPAAVAKLLQFKERPPGKAVSVFCESLGMIEDVCEVRREQKRMLQQLLPGPYTVVLPSKHTLVEKLESEQGTLGVRIPDYAPVRMLVEQFGKPLTATSANLSGKNPHYAISSLLATLSEKKKALLDVVVDAGKLPRNKPSTVIDLTQKEVTVLRVGDTLLKDRQIVVTSSEEETKALAVQLVQQYFTPEKPLGVILKGDLGSGKTIFTKGIAEAYGIEDMVSPTFVIYYEYKAENAENAPFHKLYHFDLYTITEEEEFNHLGIPELLKPGNVLVFEWGEKLGNVYESFKGKATVVFVELEHMPADKRRLTVHLENP